MQIAQKNIRRSSAKPKKSDIPWEITEAAQEIISAYGYAEDPMFFELVKDLKDMQKRGFRITMFNDFNDHELDQLIYELKRLDAFWAKHL